MKKLKGKNGTSLISLLLVIVILVIIGIIVISRHTKITSVENVFLTKDNIAATMDQYSKIKKDTDDLVYVAYAVMYYTTMDIMSNIFNPEATEDDAYVQVYGKTIRQLKNEGKALMEKNKITPREFKEKLRNLT